LTDDILPIDGILMVFTYLDLGVQIGLQENTMLDTYQLNLAGLLLLCGTLFAARPGPDANKADVDEEEKKKKKDGAKQYVNLYKGSQWSFYVVYALVMGADWLQVRPSTE
jgi:hypothetical protein